MRVSALRDLSQIIGFDDRENEIDRAVCRVLVRAEQVAESWDKTRFES